MEYVQFVESSDETCGPIVYQRESTSVNQNQQNNYNKQLNSDLSMFDIIFDDCFNSCH